MINSKLVMEALEKNKLDLAIMQDYTKKLCDQVICYGISHLDITEADKMADNEYEDLIKGAEQLSIFSKKVQMRSESIKKIFTEKKKEVM